MKCDDDIDILAADIYGACWSG